MSVFLAFGLVIVGLVIVGGVILAMDVARGDVGGRHTLARANRVLIVSTDEVTREGGERWIDAQRKEHPRMQCFVMTCEDGQELFMDVQAAVERDRPDAVVMVRHDAESHTMLEGTFGRLKEDLHIPVDAIYVNTVYVTPEDTPS